VLFTHPEFRLTPTHHEQPLVATHVEHDVTSEQAPFMSDRRERESKMKERKKKKKKRLDDHHNSYLANIKQMKNVKINKG
jgi:hypothetical protein